MVELIFSECMFHCLNIYSIVEIALVFLLRIMHLCVYKFQLMVGVALTILFSSSYNPTFINLFFYSMDAAFLKCICTFLLQMT